MHIQFISLPSIFRKMIKCQSFYITKIKHCTIVNTCIHVEFLILYVKVTLQNDHVSNSKMLELLDYCFHYRHE